MKLDYRAHIINKFLTRYHYFKERIPPYGITFRKTNILIFCCFVNLNNEYILIYNFDSILYKPLSAFCQIILANKLIILKNYQKIVFAL